MSEAPSSTRSLSRASEFSFDRWRVSVVRGPDAGLQVDSRSSEFTIGAAEGNDLRLSDAAVSRHHCLLRATPLGILLRDLESKNGTYVGGCRVESAYPAHDAEIEVGASRLRLQVLPHTVSEPISDDEQFGPVLGSSVAMRRIFDVLSRVAASHATLLLEGETGTGKGLLAEVVHRASPRAAGPFVVVDCSAIPPTLIESELFGHTRGAFTGAHAARAGAFEVAAGGSVFLDEIGELPLEVQPKLLRALEERTVKRVGSTETLNLDIRIIAATNRDLRQEVNKGTFRSDLFYRLDVVRIRIPPLRERREDIPRLVAHFYEQFVKGSDRMPPAELVSTLSRQEWPGNVRQLRSAIERAVLMEDLDLWRTLCGFDVESAPEAAPPRDAESASAERSSFRDAKERAVARWEREYVTKLVASTQGNVSAAARLARMDRNHLRELLVKHQSPVEE